MPSKRERLHAFFTENRLLKLLALALATAAVLAIQRITNQQEEFEIPIVVQMEKGVAVLRQDARTAYITCRGSFDDLRRLDPSQLRLIAAPRVSGVSGTAQVPIGPKNVNGPLRGVSVIRVRPGIVNLTFDREIIRNIAIAKPELAGKPLLGRAEIDYEPKIASVRGPKTQLTDLKILRTGPIDVDGAVDSFTQRIRILTDTETGVWAVEPAEITARVNIVTEAISREWENLPVLALQDTETNTLIRFSPSHVDLSVLGSPQAVNRIKPEDIRIFVDCLDLIKPGNYSVPAIVHVHNGVEVSTAVNPPMIAVSVLEREHPQPATTNAPASLPATIPPTKNEDVQDGLESS